MYRAIRQQATLIEVRQPRLEHCAESRDQAAANDDDFTPEEPTWRWLVLLAGNVLGGSLLLAGMFFLPHLVTVLLGGN